MDLELALGRPLDTMLEVDFRRWHQYHIRKGLPSRRLELHLAQIAMLLTHLMSDSKAPLDNFLMDPKRPEPAAGPVPKAQLQQLKQAFGFNPKGKKRRKKRHV